MTKFNTIQEYENYLSSMSVIKENELNEIKNKIDKISSASWNALLISLLLLCTSAMLLIFVRDSPIAIVPLLLMGLVLFTTNYWSKKLNNKYKSKYNLEKIDYDFTYPIPLIKLAIISKVDNSVFKNKLREIKDIRKNEILEIDYGMLLIEDNLELLGITREKLLKE